MIALAAVAICLALGIGLVAFAAWALEASSYSAPVTSDEVHIITTPDLWRIRLYRHKAKKGPGEPVFLCHGFMSNQWNFTVPPGESMADLLASEGYDCWLIDLRGARSSIPAPGRTLDEPTVDDYLLKDIPTAIDYIRDATGFDKVHWVGHSMGGMLLYAYDAVFGPKHLASGTTLGSPIGFTGVKFHRPSTLFLIRKSSGRLFRCVQRILVSLLNLFHPQFDAVPINWKNMNKRIDVKALFSSLEVPPIPVAESLANAAQKRVWRVNDALVDVFENLPNLHVPLFAIFGAADPFVPVPTIDGFFSAIPIEDKKLLLLSKENGHAADYSHVDLAMGPEIHKEVVKPIVEWFQAHSVSETPDTAPQLRAAVPALAPIFNKLDAAVAVLDKEPASRVRSKKATASSAKKPAAAKKASVKKPAATKKAPAKKPATKKRASE